LDEKPAIFCGESSLNQLFFLYDIKHFATMALWTEAAKMETL